MKLQMSTRLALYSVLELVAHPGRPVSAGGILAKVRGVDASPPSKVAARAGARGHRVESAHGVGGGYRFAGNAKRLTLMDVIGLFEDIGGGGLPDGSTQVERALATVLSKMTKSQGNLRVDHARHHAGS